MSAEVTSEGAAAVMTVRLPDDQLERLAVLVAEQLEHRPRPSTPSGMVDAATVAQELGVARSWVYGNAAALGATRLGTGSRGRLRFDLERARAAFVTAETSEPRPRAPRARPRRRTSTAGSILRPRSKAAA